VEAVGLLVDKKNEITALDVKSNNIGLDLIVAREEAAHYL